MTRIFLALLLVFAPFAARGQEAPPDRADGWAVAAPDGVGLDPAVLAAIGPRYDAWKEANVHAVLVARHGRLAFERYFTGDDEHWGKPLPGVAFDAGMRHDLRSVTKSVVSLVVGIAMDRGEFPGLDAPVLPLFPEYADLRSPERDRITVRHLLTMSQGLAWNEDLPYADPRNSEIRMDTAADPVRYALAQPIERPPGEAFNYSGGSATILAALIRRRTGRNVDDYARAALFAPLGITDVEWSRLTPDAPLAASGLRLRPRDTAKLGQLVLDRGAWRGTRVVPAAWIEAATTPRLNAWPLWFYGYQFWLGRSLVHGKPVDWIAGVGLGGQRLFVVPALDLVVLVHSGLYRSPMQSFVPVGLLNRYVLPAVRE